MNSAYISVLLGGLIGSTSTLIGALLSHRLTRDRDRRNTALQGLRELAVVRMRMTRRDELEFEADLATIQYQWTVAEVSSIVTSTYLDVARYGARLIRDGGELDDGYLRLLSQLEDLVQQELIKPARGRLKTQRERLAASLTKGIVQVRHECRELPGDIPAR